MENVVERIKEKCLVQNLEFIGFNNEENEYKNSKTKLILKCKDCGYTWNTSTYEKLMYGKSRKCPKCSGCYVYSIEELEKDIIERCKELDFEYLGFVDRVGKSHKLRLKCNKCGYTWETTTYLNLMRRDRRSHTCGRNNPSSMPRKKINVEELEKKVKEKLEGTSLEFICFCGDDDYKKDTCLTKCKKCGIEETYHIKTILQNDVIQCKICERSGKFSNDFALSNIKEKCELLGYDFLGFDNERNRYNGKKNKIDSEV